MAITLQTTDERAIVMRSEMTGGLVGLPNCIPGMSTTDPDIKPLIVHVVGRWASYDGEGAARIAAAETDDERAGTAEWWDRARGDLHERIRNVETSCDDDAAKIQAERDVLLGPPPAHGDGDAEVRAGLDRLTAEQRDRAMSAYAAGKHRAELEAAARGPSFDLVVAEQARRILRTIREGEAAAELAELAKAEARVDWKRTVLSAIKTAVSRSEVPLSFTDAATARRRQRAQATG